MLEESVTIRERGLPPGDWRRANARSLLGAALLGLGRRAEAEPMIVSAAEVIAASADAPANVKASAQARVAALRGR